MRIGIAGTPELKSFKKVARKVLQELGDEDLVFEEHTAEALGRKGVPMKKLKADVLVSIGGDGTILRNIQATSIPILGVNAGVLGFLTEVQPDEIRESMAQFLRGDYKIERRLRLKIMVDGKRMKDATNEAVVHTAHVAKMRHFVVSVDHKPATIKRLKENSGRITYLTVDQIERLLKAAGAPASIMPLQRNVIPRWPYPSRTIRW